MVHRISATLDVRKLMTKEEYDPNNDGKISLGIIDIDQDLNMGSHNIVIDEGYKIDGIDVSEHTHTTPIQSQSCVCDVYEYSEISAGEEKLLASTTHNFSTPHNYILIGFKYSTPNVPTVHFKYRLYVAGELKIEESLWNFGNETHEAAKHYSIDEELGSGISVEFKIYVEDNSLLNVKAYYISCIAYSLEKPS